MCRFCASKTGLWTSLSEEEDEKGQGSPAKTAEECCGLLLVWRLVFVIPFLNGVDAMPSHLINQSIIQIEKK